LQVIFFYKSGKEPIIAHEKIRKAITGCSAFILNLEAPIVDENPAFIQKVGPIMHQSKCAVNILKTMGITAVTLANNHIMDGDRGGIQNTLSTLNASNIEFFGFEGSISFYRKALNSLEFR
jgi:poly-gamma-glutamate capsule biosynthesis protein CapA/YwtB (metallophosphatase superfamily)